MHQNTISCRRAWDRREIDNQVVLNKFKKINHLPLIDQFQLIFVKISRLNLKQRLASKNLIHWIKFQWVQITTNCYTNQNRFHFFRDWLHDAHNKMAYYMEADVVPSHCGLISVHHLCIFHVPFTSPPSSFHSITTQVTQNSQHFHKHFHQ